MMKRTAQTGLILLLTVLLVLGLLACRKPSQQAAVPSASPAADLWTVPPDEPSAKAESDTDEISHSASPSPAPADTLLPASEATEPSVEVTPVSSAVSPAPSPVPTDAPAIDKNGVYTSKEDVALYLHTYGQLPGNFITKKQAQALGWSGGYLEPYAPGMCIGGDYFGNYERALPVKKGRSYYECDIDTLHKRSRGAKRMIWSNDGLIYYTDNHYESFTLLYGGD